VASVLLIEDEIAHTHDDCGHAGELGHSVAGEASDSQSGLLLVSAPGVDAAILDIQLGDHSSVPIAEALHSKGLPFAFASGYGASGAPQGFEDYPVL
jgi:DNA-binding NarL/FixJ family response regulator